jgi:hypothetical protein
MGPVGVGVGGWECVCVYWNAQHAALARLLVSGTYVLCGDSVLCVSKHPANRRVAAVAPQLLCTLPHALCCAAWQTCGATGMLVGACMFLLRVAESACCASPCCDRIMPQAWAALLQPAHSQP